jgi:hypothetical protein
MGTDGAFSLLFCAAKQGGAFPPDMPAGLRARASRLGGFTRPISGLPGYRNSYWSKLKFLGSD